MAEKPKRANEETNWLNDAQLISAAPDLLEACELAQTEILSSKAFNIRKDFTLFNYLAQAINKAKGEK